MSSYKDLVALGKAQKRLYFIMHQVKMINPIALKIIAFPLISHTISSIIHDHDANKQALLTKPIILTIFKWVQETPTCIKINNYFWMEKQRKFRYHPGCRCCSAECFPGICAPHLSIVNLTALIWSQIGSQSHCHLVERNTHIHAHTEGQAQGHPLIFLIWIKILETSRPGGFNHFDALLKHNIRP